MTASLADYAGNTVSEARYRASEMLRWESNGPGDTEDAMARITRRYRLPKSTLWRLRYAPPKRIWADVLRAIEIAYETERQRQIRKLEHDALVTAVLAGADHPVVVKAQAVVRAGRSAADGQKTEEVNR